MSPKRLVDVIERQTAFDGYFRIDRYRLRHELFTGGLGPEVTRELFERGHAAAILPYDPAADTVVLIEQFRVGAYAYGSDPWLIEIIAGILDPGETPEQLCHREAEEEAGVIIDRLEPALKFFTSPGGSSEFVHTFIGRTDASNAGGIHGLDHEGEDIRVLVLDFREAIDRLEAGTILFGPAAVTLQWLDRHRDRLRAAWR